MHVALHASETFGATESSCIFLVFLDMFATESEALQALRHAHPVSRAGLIGVGSIWFCFSGNFCLLISAL